MELQGLKTSLGDFIAGLQFAGREDQEIQESYDMLSGKKDTYENHCNES